MNCKTNIPQNVLNNTSGILDRYALKTSNEGLSAIVRSYQIAINYQATMCEQAPSFDHTFFNHTLSNFTDILSTISEDDLSFVLSLIIDSVDSIRNERLKTKIILIVNVPIV